MKNFKKATILSLLISFVFLVGSCGPNKKNDSEYITPEGGGGEPAETYDPEETMDKFVNKIFEANYVIEGADFRTDVYSNDLVTVTYDRTNWNNYAFMSVNDKCFRLKF